MNAMLQNNRPVDYNDLTGILDFLKIFADKCHHGKEEGIYFPALEEAGIENIDVLLEPLVFGHAQSRECIKNMENSLADNKIQNDKFINASEAYIRLLRLHIDKENIKLFPMGDLKLTESTQHRLINSFEKFEEKIISKGKHEKLHKKLNYFESKYL